MAGIDYRTWLTMQDIDQGIDRPKGTAFRAFKRLLPTLREGRDFVVLGDCSGTGIDAELRAAGRIYASSIHPVLLSPATAGRIVKTLDTDAGPPP